jgi:NhaP-type Na+/H+ or K+/H+ antiporter
MATEQILLITAAVLAVCTACQWIAWRVRLPAIIFLLFAGILAGPVYGLLHPEKLLGDFFLSFISLSVAIILFEGSLTLKFKDISGLESVVQKMVSIGMVVTWLITAVVARYSVGLSWEVSFLFGAITVVTGPTVIAPMLRTVRPKQSISNILRWEAVTIDPIGASLAVLVYELIISFGAEDAWLHTFFTFGKIISVGIIAGVCSGYLFGLAIRNHWLPEFLQNVASFSVVIVVYVASNMLQLESGLVTVTIMGIWLTNMKDVDVEELLDFKESITILLISLLFIMLASRLDINFLEHLGWRVVLVLIAIQFLARPLNVMISTFRSNLTWPERHMLAWIAPRGIIAAAISSVFAVHLENAGFSDARLLVPLTFSVIIFTVVLQSVTARPIARMLKVAEPEPTGFLIIGANPVGRAVARALILNKLNVIIADTGWENISKAKLDGLRTYLGNPISEHADRHLDLIGIGRMLALSPFENVNVSSAMHFRMEFGSNNVFIIQSKFKDESPERERIATQKVGKILFGNMVTYAIMADVLSKDGEIRTTKLTEKFDFTSFIEKQGQKAFMLFAIDLRGNTHIYHESHNISPRPGWVITYLNKADTNSEKANQPNAADAG